MSDKRTPQRQSIVFDADYGDFRAYVYGERLPGWYRSYLEAEQAIDAYEPRQQQRVLDLRTAARLLPEAVYEGA